MIFSAKYRYVGWLPVIIHGFAVSALITVFGEEATLCTDLTLVSSVCIATLIMMFFFRELKYPFQPSQRYAELGLSPFQYTLRESRYIIFRPEFIIINIIAISSMAIGYTEPLGVSFAVYAALTLIINASLVFISSAIKAKKGDGVTNNALTALLFILIFQLQLTSFFDYVSPLKVNPLASAPWLIFFSDSTNLWVISLASIATFYGLVTWYLLRIDLKYWE